MDPNIMSRYLDIYSNILQNTLVNYNQTNDTIRQVETGIRELMNHSIQPEIGMNINNNLNTTIPHPTSSLYHNPFLSPIQSYNNTEPILNSSFRQSNRQNTRQNIRNINRLNRRQTFNSARNNLNNDSLFSHFFTNNHLNLDNLTPVIVRPTPDEISNAIEDISWNVDIGSTMCPITQEQFTTNDIVSRIHHCGHSFSHDALKQWFTLSVYCPVCRYDIRNYTNDTANDTTNNIVRNEPMSNNESNSENNITSNSVSSDILTSVRRHITQALNPLQNQSGLNSRDDIDISNNVLFNRSNNTIGDIAFEYIIQTTPNVYSSSSSLSNDNLSSLLRDAFLGINNNNSNNNSNNS